MADFAPDLKKMLKNGDCDFVRQGRGDHEIWQSPHTNRRFSVPTKIRSRHTANEILKQAGLEKAF